MEADKLRARGVPVQLKDERLVHIRLDFDAMAELDRLEGHWNRWYSRILGGSYEAVINGFAATHVIDDVPRNGWTALLDTKKLRTYIEAFDQALTLALPDVDPEQDADPKATAETGSSPTATSSPSPSDSSASDPATSGG